MTAHASVLDPARREDLAQRLLGAGLEAARAVMEVYRSDFGAVYKTDGSPVTDADGRAEAIILARLAEHAPGVPALAEESAGAAAPIDPDAPFFLVDPLDGTREFINRNGEFTVNIALIDTRRPVIGVVIAPALARAYVGVEGCGAMRIDCNAALEEIARAPIRARQAPAAGAIAVASRSHRTPETDLYLKAAGVTAFTEAGSSLKFCLIAEGAADLYPRFGRTMEWDVAAGHAVLAAAGGSVCVHPDGAPLAYGKCERGFDNPSFIARGAG